jgi:hypothetical protein
VSNDKSLRGIRSLDDNYSRCNVVVTKPINFEEAINS